MLLTIVIFGVCLVLFVFFVCVFCFLFVFRGFCFALPCGFLCGFGLVFVLFQFLSMTAF